VLSSRFSERKAVKAFCAVGAGLSDMPCETSACGVILDGAGRESSG
jgi:hypothetical protein